MGEGAKAKVLYMDLINQMVLDDKAARIGWEKTSGDKMTNPKSIRERLRQKEQMVYCICLRTFVFMRVEAVRNYAWH